MLEFVAQELREIVYAGPWRRHMPHRTSSPATARAFDETFTMVPTPRSSMAGNTALVQKMVPVRLMAISCSISSCVVSMVPRWGTLAPALLTRTSTRPQRSSTSVTAAS